MAITFSIPDTEIIMTSGQTEVSCQDLLDAIREFEDEFMMMGLDWIADASGKTVIDPANGVYTEIVLALRDPWTIRFEDEDTAHCAVRGGTLVAFDAIGDPRPVSTNYGLTINQSVSGTLVISDGGGSPEDIADAVWDELGAGHVASGSFGKALQDLPSANDVDTELTTQHGSGDWTTADLSTLEAGMVELLARLTLSRAAALDDIPGISTNVTLLKKIDINRLELENGSDDNWVLYDDDDVTPLLTWSVSDYLGNDLSLPTGLPGRRTRGV
jgi:hypothetical protein